MYAPPEFVSKILSPLDPASSGELIRFVEGWLRSPTRAGSEDS